jgi:hypothetical protein
MSYRLSETGAFNLPIALTAGVLTPSATHHTRMGYGIAVSKRSYRRMSPEDHETLSLGQDYSLRMMARCWGEELPVSCAASWLPSPAQNVDL